MAHTKETGVVVVESGKEFVELLFDLQKETIRLIQNEIFDDGIGNCGGVPIETACNAVIDYLKNWRKQIAETNVNFNDKDIYSKSL